MVERDLRPAGRGAAAREIEVAAHAEVREQRGLLEHHAHGAPMRRQEHAASVVLPGFAADAQPAGHAQQPGHGAQAACLARARRPEQRGEAAAWQVQVEVEPEARVGDLEPCFQGRGVAHRVRRGDGRSVYSSSKTTKLNESIAADRACADAYSMASTWS